MKNKISNKFFMERSFNVFLAKRNIVDYIYKSANLEGISVTYPETQQIFDGGNVAGLKVDEIVAINNLKHGWEFILNEPPLQDSYAVLCEINRIVGSNLIPMAGRIRTFPVSMGGTSWKPQFPVESQIKEELEEHLEIEDATDRALTIMLWTMRRQMFSDGNKRTAMLFANKIMIDNGCGIIQIPIEQQSTFYTKLIHFYETNEMEDIKEWLFENCIDGVAFDQINQRNEEEKEIESEELEL